MKLRLPEVPENESSRALKIFQALRKYNVVIAPEDEGVSMVYVSDHAIADRVSTLDKWHIFGDLDSPGVLEFLVEHNPDHIILQLRQCFIDPTDYSYLYDPSSKHFANA